MSFLGVVIILLLFFEISNKEIQNNLAVVKFKTFYPKTSNMLKDNYEFDNKDYIKSIVFSQIYFELETGDEKNHQAGTSQVLNAFSGEKTKSFSFISADDIFNLEENNTLCLYNISLSNTNKFDSNSDTVEEIFKFYSDISMNNYNYIPLNCYRFDLNDSLCGEIGVDLLTAYHPDVTNFIPQVLKNLNISEKSYAFKYTSKDEGLFLMGDVVHNYLDSEYNESNLVSFYSKITAWEITLDSIILEGYNISAGDIYDYVYVSISPEYEGLVFSEYYIDILNRIYFNDYFKKYICRNESVSTTPSFTIITCDGNEFGKEDIKKFPKITFPRYRLNFNITFEGEELFYFRDNKYYFKIYKVFSKSRQFIFGKIFLRKYLTIFNPEKKQISFYKTKLRNLEEINNGSQNNKKIIILLLFLLAILVFLIIGIFIGKQIFEKRKKHANELEDNYLYETKKDSENEVLFDEKKEEK